MERKIIYKENSEEYKAIKLLEQKTKKYSLNGNDLHYALILYNLIVSLSIENQQLKEKLKDVNKSLKNVQQEKKLLKQQLLVTQTNEETFRLEMKDITQTLGLDENTLFDDVKVYVRSLKDNWNELKEYIDKTKIKEFEKSYGKRYGKTFTQAEVIVCNMILNKMQELQGNDSDE